jgi:hypothetical protein
MHANKRAQMRITARSDPCAVRPKHIGVKYEAGHIRGLRFDLIRLRGVQRMEASMKRLLNSALVVVALLIAATAVLRSQPSATNFSVATAGMMSLQEIGAAAGLNKLPIEEFEDQSLVYSAAPKH